MVHNARTVSEEFEESAFDSVLKEEPLPWRTCALLIFLGSVFSWALCYGAFTLALRMLTS